MINYKFRLYTYEDVIDILETQDNFTIEVGLNCCEQGIDDFIQAYYIIMMDKIKKEGLK